MRDFRELLGFCVLVAITIPFIMLATVVGMLGFIALMSMVESITGWAL